jgi:hypothetical protein
MAPKEVVITDDYTPPVERSISDLLAAAVARGASTHIDLSGLLENADVVEGRPLVDKASMIGVPHIITSVAFRKGNRTPDGTQHDFVSCEFTTITKAPIEGVYNDGSTGIRRQVVGYLAGKGIVPAEYVENPDTPIWVAPTDEAEKDPEFGIRFLAPRGLRVSQYKNEFTDEGLTYYLA